MSELFHYTSSAGAIGIIESGCLYATHYSFLNDSSELSHLRKLVEDRIEKEVRAFEEIYVGRADDADKSRMKDSFEKFTPEFLLHSLIKTADTQSPSFLTSFCLHPKDSSEWLDGLLSQWRGYGASGGCAIEFDKKSIEDLLLKEQSEYAYTTVAMDEVVYDEEDHIRQVEDIKLEKYVSAVVCYFLDKNETYKEVFISEMYDLLVKLQSLTPMLKNYSFREEREIRISAPAVRKKYHEEVEAKGKSTSKKLKPVLFRTKGNLPVPYIRLFDGSGPLPIKRIIVGPQPNRDKVKYAVEYALENNNISAEVVCSSMTFIP